MHRELLGLCSRRRNIRQCHLRSRAHEACRRSEVTRQTHEALALAQ